MHRLLREGALWLPPLLLMALIFALSAMPGDGQHHGFLYVFTRKLGHFIEYALLMALWWRALRTRVSVRAAVALGLVLTVGYAVTDELHQLGVDDRNGSPLDVVIDAAGAAAASGLILLRERSRPVAGAAHR
jgi:VanZ family protein